MGLTAPPASPTPSPLSFTYALSYENPHTLSPILVSASGRTWIDTLIHKNHKLGSNYLLNKVILLNNEVPWSTVTIFSLKFFNFQKVLKVT